MTFRLGIDAGDSFIDFFLLDADNAARIYKSLATRDDPLRSLLDGLQDIAEDFGLSLSDFVRDLDLIVHASSVAQDAVLYQSGARTGLLIASNFHERLSDEQVSALNRLQPPQLRFNVRVQNDSKDEESDVLVAAKRFRDGEVTAVAICLGWTHTEQLQEARSAEILKRELPDVHLSISSELLAQSRFYDLVSTTVLDAYVAPVVQEYLKHLTERLAELEFSGLLQIMQSNGGVAMPPMVASVPAATIRAGAAAAPAALDYIEPHRYDHAFILDMDSARFDITLLADRRPYVVTDQCVGAYPLALPMIDVRTIGAGGSSTGWLKPDGVLQTGSRHSDTTPACFGQGGERPTVIDAVLALGYLDPEQLLGGKLPLHLEYARAAIQSMIAAPRALDVDEAAAEFLRVFNQNMSDIIRQMVAQHSWDLSEFVMVAAGIHAPLHAAAIAKKLQVPLVIVPRSASVFRAAGMLFADIKHDFMRPYATPLTQIDRVQFKKLCTAMRYRAYGTFADEHVPPERQRLEYSMDVCLVEQASAINVPLTTAEIGALDLNAIFARLRATYDQSDGDALQIDSVELLAVRLTAIGRSDVPYLQASVRRPYDSSHALVGRRRVYLLDLGDFAAVPLYDGNALNYGNRVEGPALIELPFTAIFVPPEYDAYCDTIGNFMLVLREQAQEFEEQLS